MTAMMTKFFTGLLFSGAFVLGVLGYAAPKTGKLTVTELLRRALKQYPGRIIEIKKAQKHGQNYYEVKILSPQGRLRELRFEAESGNESGKLFRVEDEREREAEHLNQTQVMPLEHFLEQLKLKDVLEVELKARQGQGIYVVKWLDSQGQFQRRNFDARTGKPLTK